MIHLMGTLVVMFLLCLCLILIYVNIAAALERREANKKFGDYDPHLLEHRKPKAIDKPVEGVYTLDDILKTLPEELRRDFR